MTRNILITIICFQLASAILLAEENTKFYFVHKYLFSNNNTLSDEVAYSNSNTSISSQKGKGYSLNLYGIGIKYKIISNSYLDFAYTILPNKVTVTNKRFIDYTYNTDSISNYDIISLNEIALGYIYDYKIRNRLSIPAGIGMNFTRGSMWINSYDNYLANDFSPYLKLGINYNLAKRCDVGINISYNWRKNLDFQINESRSSSSNINIDINPLSIEAVLLLYL
ncbi:MAG: hypothetical protein LHV68_00910 [Elusimicrobia bacterium]|nr:hypothetical protein [Candidatus Liberimonas magnetica]